MPAPLSPNDGPRPADVTGSSFLKSDDSALEPSDWMERFFPAHAPHAGEFPAHAPHAGEETTVDDGQTDALLAFAAEGDRPPSPTVTAPAPAPVPEPVAAKPIAGPVAVSDPPPAPMLPLPLAPTPAAPLIVLPAYSPPKRPPAFTSSGRRIGLLAAAGVAVVAIGFGAVREIRTELPTPPTIDKRPAQVTVNTRPDGAEIVVDGRLQGISPLTFLVAPGTHALAIRLDGAERDVPLTVTAGSQIAHYIEVPTTAKAEGEVSVVSDPAGARVVIDGHVSGVTPVVVSLSAADHQVSVSAAGGSAERTVSVEPGAKMSVVFSLAKSSASPPAGGWLALDASFELQILERDEVVGTSTTRIMLAAGRHHLVMVNRNLGYQEDRTIEIAPGRVITLHVEAPKAALSVNARPWADVSIDAADAGQTPIADLMVPIGAHQVIFRHPQYGERRETVVVTTKGPNRIAADLTKD